MSKRRAPTFGDLADGAAGGRRVVMSCGSLDGALLQALQRLNLCAIEHIGEPSTWGPGVSPDGEIANAIGDKQTPTGIANPFSGLPEEGATNGKDTPG